MTVKELIEILSQYDNDTPVFIDGPSCLIGGVSDYDGKLYIY